MRLAFERHCEECGSRFTDEDRWGVEPEDGAIIPYPLIPTKYLGLCDSCLYGHKCDACGDFTLPSERHVYDEVDGYSCLCERCHVDMLLSPEEQADV